MRKKRALCLLLALLLVLSLAPAASGASSLAFVAVNDSIPMTLSGESIPFYMGGALYVPYTAFGAAGLGIYPSYAAADKTLALFDRSRRLVFDLAAGTVSDERGLVQEMSVIFSGGTPFLPAAFCAGHFDIQVSGLTSRSGYQVVRFTNGSQVYDDSLFIEKAENLISYRVSQYEADNAPGPAAPATEQPTHRPAPQPAQSKPDDSEEPDQELPPATVCLAVVGLDDAEAALNALSAARQTAAFFLSEAEIRENGDLVRRIAAPGHRIGLRIEGDGDPAESLRQANEALDQALQRKTLLALAPADLDTAALEERYCVFRANAVSVEAAVEAHGETRLLFCGSETVPEALTALRRAEVNFLPLRETTALP